ncbi:MAG TPA: MlaD family protein [Planctomycetota bacterium]|jgi:hypothetical protein
MAPRNYSQIEVKVGVFVTLSAALFISMLITYGRLAPVWRGRTELRIAFSDIGGLRPDAPVRYNGVEVGRVKQIQLLHLDDDTLDRFAKFSKTDLDNLPLWPETLTRELRAVNDDDFDARCRAALKNRTMVELRLEVLQEGDVKRYRLDDRVRIVATVFGNAAVEIISGKGAVNQPASNQLILGTSGDFFSNLAKSMGEVKEILGSVTDVVGMDERRSFERAFARLAPIVTHSEQIAATSGARTAATTHNMDALGDHIERTLNNASDGLDSLRPQSRQTFDLAAERLRQVQQKLRETQTEGATAWQEAAGDLEVIQKDVETTLNSAKPDFETAKMNFRQIYDRLGGLSTRLDGMRDTAGEAMAQSQPDLERGVAALQNSLTNLKHTGEAANENKDLMISNRDTGEYEYATALDIYRRMVSATRRIREAGADLQDTTSLWRQLSASAIQTGSMSTGNAPAAAPVIWPTLESLMNVRQPLEQQQGFMEDRLVPAFVRKRAGGTDEVAGKVKE